MPRILLLGFFGLEVIYLFLVRLGDWRQHTIPFLLAFGVAFGGYVTLIWAIRRWSLAIARDPSASDPEAHGRGRCGGRWLLGGVVLGGLVFRATLVGVTPTLSDDIYRYVWDGRVQQAGVNPYRYAPDDEALAHFRTPDWDSINHKSIPTIYPPLMQLAFRFGAALSPTVLAQKAMFLGCDIAVMLLLLAWLPRVGVNPMMGLLYAWHPLVVVEVAGSGHNDPLGVLWMVLGLALWTSRRRAMGTLAFALSFLSKLTTALLWPFYWVRARGLLGWFALAVLPAGLWCWRSPYFAPGFSHYASRWEFNSSLYAILQAFPVPPLAARIACGLIVLVTGFVAARRTEDLIAYTRTMLQTAVLAAPVVEPWYLLWLLPLLCLRFSWVWLVFTGLAMLSYLVRVPYVSPGLWKIPAWVLWVEYVPVYAWLMMRWLKRADEGRRDPSSL